MVRFRGKSCLGPSGPGEGGSRPPRGSRRTPPQAGVGSKTRSAGRGPTFGQTRTGSSSIGGATDTTARSPHMEFTFKGRGLRITDEVREVARHKLSRLARMEPRATLLEVEVIAQRNPRLDAF